MTGKLSNMAMEMAVNAARWVVVKALGFVMDGPLEAWAASSGLAPNVRTLKMELLCAQGILDNVRGRDVRSPALGHLLFELRDLAYIADDVLDELEYFRIQDDLEGTYETADPDDRGCIGGLILNARHTATHIASKLNLSQCSRNDMISNDSDEGKEEKKCCLWSCSWPAKHKEVHVSVIDAPVPKLNFDRVQLSKKILDLVDQLRLLCDKVSTVVEMEILGSAIHKLDLLGTSSTTAAALNRPRTSSPQITQSKLYGREQLKLKLVEALTRDKQPDNEITVHSIFGPGGIGKTTLVQHVYSELRKCFDLSVWISVSQNFAANRLAEELKANLPTAGSEEVNLTVQEVIQRRLQSKRLLLVLDDVWTYHEDEWEGLLAPLKKGGTKGHLVIVTTRLPRVAELVATKDNLMRLERLSDHDCLCLFQSFVFGDEQSCIQHTDLHGVGLEIVSKLKGFPLAAKTVGRLLRKRLTVDYWNRVLESKEWELQSGDDDIMPALMVSFNYLIFEVQQCFSYCGLFPEDHEFSEEELIHFWIGLGVLGSSNQNKRIEDIGLEYLNEMLDHGFVEKFEKDDGRIFYRIHDLLHELAKTVSSTECLNINDISNVRSIQVQASIRHLSISVNKTDINDRRTFENCKNELTILGRRLKAENLRTIMLFGKNHGSFYKAFSDLFAKAKGLRVLFLSEVTYNLEDLLPGFSELLHLRYLRITGFILPEITLPSSISRFYHLLILDLKKCYCLFPSVRHMSNLVKMRHFLVRDDKFHSEISEVGELKYLQELKRFEVKKDMNGFELKQLGKLLHLRGSLGIYNLERLKEMIEADEANLSYMNHLNQLVLEWGANRSSKDPKKEEEVIERLKPNSNVREVCIRGHCGDTCPSWLGVDLYLKNLESLLLDGVAWRNLPPIGNLWMVNEHGEEYKSCITGQCFHHLKRLELVGMQKLKKWCVNGTQLFPALEFLNVTDCPELVELPLSHSLVCPDKQENIVAVFPKLQEVNISNCRKLLSLSPVPWADGLSLAAISQVGTGIERIRYVKNQQHKYVFIQMGNDALDSTLWNMLAFENLSETEGLHIYECPPVPLGPMQMLSSLKRLTINKCGNVLWPVEHETNGCYKFAVEDVEFCRCDASGEELTRFVSYFPKITKFKLHDCKMVTGLGMADEQSTATPAPSPAAEEIESVVGLLLLPPQIQELDIEHCPDLRLQSVSLNGLASLRMLRISGCPKFLSSSSSSSNAALQLPNSIQALHLSNIESMFTLVPLSNLTNVYIKNCGNLTGKDLWLLLAQGHVTELTILKCPNLFVADQSSWQDEQDFLNLIRLQVLYTDGKEGILAAPICTHLSSSLTKLVFGYNDDIERFTNEQHENFQKLASLQELEITSCSKLEALPAGLCALAKFKKLHITFCPAIKSFPKDGLPNSLTELWIYECPSICSLPKGRLPSSLQMLRVSDSGNVELIRQCRKLEGTIPIIEA